MMADARPRSYIACIDRLLAALRQSGALRLLRELWPLLRESNHVHQVVLRRAAAAARRHAADGAQAAIDDALADYVARLDERRAYAAFDACAAAIVDAANPPVLRLVARARAHRRRRRVAR